MQLHMKTGRLLLLALLLLSPLSVHAFERRTPVVMAVEKAGPAVVNIRTEQIVKRRATPFFGFADPFFEEFFRDLSPPRVYKTESLGSGVVIDPKGYVLTNAHVIEKASKIFVALPQRSKELEAKLVGMDERIDLAVLKIEGEGNFPYLPPARSDDLLTGETVIAIGNPLGLGHSITTGVVSARSRRLETGAGAFSVFIQTDALINPGNSGGPLLNINGELIGINTAIARQAQGIGFAIPIDTARRVLGDLRQFGRVRPAYLGIVPGPVGAAFARARGKGGVLVESVDGGSPAAAAGIRVADVVLSLDDEPVGAPDELNSLLQTYTPDDRLRLTLLRGTETLQVSVRMGRMPAGYALRYAEKVFGLALTEEGGGVVIRRVVEGSSAERLGIRSGDMVAQVDGETVQSVTEFERLLEGRFGRKPLRFLIVRGGRGYYVDLP